MPSSPRLSIDYIGTGEIQSFVTVNELIDAIDALVQTSVVSTSLTAPPGTFVEGDLYIVAPGGTGAWADHDKAIAQGIGGAWKFYLPQAGWIAWNQAITAFTFFDGGSWVPFP